MEMLPMLLLAPVLVAVAYCDLRFMRIPNVFTLLAIAIFGFAVFAYPPEDLTSRLVVAGIVLALGCVGFAFRLFGGGDVKILSALMLAVPTHGLAVFANVFSASMIGGIVLVLALRRLTWFQGRGWKTFDGSTKFPMGLSIALSGLAFPFVV
jgi:prepilin peptidase CpaA